MIKQIIKILSIFSTVAIPVTTWLMMFSTWFGIATFVFSVILIISTWVLYVEAMRLKRLKDNDSIELYHYPWAIIVLGIGIPLDALLNIVIGLYWKELPKWNDKEILLTNRLQRWKSDDSHLSRQIFAEKICKYLNKHDEDHC